MIGMSFRGKIFGDIGYRGITVDREKRRVLWQGEPLIPEKQYTLRPSTTFYSFHFSQPSRLWEVMNCFASQNLAAGYR